ncbi:hypothetical protein VST7929_00365 [Vibrio stylophorae]|uniref:Uncharacterized protein n=1 Tax=Vibrio stylophorae TaxID=659351 RepID=A0ABN8DP48_9VIBR|nr:hypothetical protein VST7929_00365 [Vibrio stylophorae]
MRFPKDKLDLLMVVGYCAVLFSLGYILVRTGSM